MRRINAEQVAVLANPTWADARRGAFAAWIYISVVVPTGIGLWITVTSAIASAQYPSSLLSNLSMVAYISVIAFVCVVIISGIVIAAVGVPAGMLLARTLARVTTWQIHLLGYFIAGAAAYGAILLILRLLDPSDFGFFGVFLWLGPFTPLLIGACVAAGWATAWHTSVKRATIRPEDTSRGESFFSR